MLPWQPLYFKISFINTFSLNGVTHFHQNSMFKVIHQGKFFGEVTNISMLFIPKSKRGTKKRFTHKLPLFVRPIHRYGQFLSVAYSPFWFQKQMEQVVYWRHLMVSSILVCQFRFYVCRAKNPMLMSGFPILEANVAQKGKSDVIM